MFSHAGWNLVFCAFGQIGHRSAAVFSGGRDNLGIEIFFKIGSKLHGPVEDSPTGQCVLFQPVAPRASM